MRSFRTAVLVPCYRRPEYTEKCLGAIFDAQDYPDTDFYLVDDGSKDGTDGILRDINLRKIVTLHADTIGLRRTIIEFFRDVSGKGYEILAKMDNDCRVPSNWLSDIWKVMDETDVDILSPNVMPSNAAETYGIKDENLPYRPSKFVGGLWAMRAHLPEGIFFEESNVYGIRGAFHLLNQIILEKEPKVGWLPQVVVDDIGHWSGKHPEHIKSPDHLEYSVEIGRSVAWGV